ncbi:MAG: DUF3667 domain-containing protein [Sphingomonadales bacterium]|nr:DUF3667 domain-containing protein [Sphingomonadales bacterium]MBD3774793.1 DUF3667 domain-containing protein [Paracoccaceae bacterium]
MSEISDAIGDGVDEGHACLNCGTALVGDYCHACGQTAHIHRSIGAFLHDLMHGALHFEGKIWHTLPLLVWQPGQLTRRYIDGERARFVSPMALFLFVVFLMFASFQLAGISTPVNIQRPAEAESNFSAAEGEFEARIASARAKLDAMAAGDPARAAAETDLQDAQDGLAAFRKTRSFMLGEGNTMSLKPQTGVEWVDHGLAKWREHPELMLYKLQANFYKFSWLLIPLSLPFVWLLFLWRREYGPYDHAVFVTYSLSFVTLLFIVLALLGVAGLSGSGLLLAGCLLPLWHMHRQLKGTYALGNVSALWRVAVLALFIGVVLVLFLQVLILLGIMG